MLFRFNGQQFPDRVQVKFDIDGTIEDVEIADLKAL